MTGNDQQPDPSDGARDEARDRLTDRVLTEALGGERPPDLSAPILDSLEEQKVDATHQTVEQQRTRKPAGRWMAIAVAASLLGVGFYTILLPSVQANREAARRNQELQQERLQLSVPPTSEASELETRFGELSDSVVVNEPAPVDGVMILSDGRSSAPSSTPRNEAEAMELVAELQRNPTPENEALARQAMSRYQKLARGAGAPPEDRRGAMALGVDAPVSTDLAAVAPDIEIHYAETPPAYGINAKAEPASAAPGQAVAGGLGGGGANAGGGRSESADFVDARFEELAQDSTPMGRTATAAPATAGAIRSRRSAAIGVESPSTRNATGGSNNGRFAVGPAINGDGGLAWRLQNPNEERLSRHSESRKSESDTRFGFQQQPGRWRRWPAPEPRGRDRYATIQENPFTKPTGQKALSTFSVDVDTASYTNVRQYLLDNGGFPPPGAVRVEELINYFDYAYQPPAADSETPFTASLEVGPCPWKPEHRLVRIGVKGREMDAEKRPLSNLVFLVDVSGSMNEPNKLPLVVEGLKALTDRLGENDRVAIVVYAGNEGIVLPSTSGERRDEIRSSLGRLTAGGSTAGGAGIKLAYEIAERNQIVGGVNRVVLCTDGDFNVGLTGTEQLAELVETRAKETGVFLTVLGFGRGNLNDEMLETISGRGNGHYAYIDSEREARRVLSRDLAGTLVTIAKDVKLQVEFNPANVGAYRLIGYENRVMAAKDFADDTKDAGEIGAGHTVTALYEVVPVGVESGGAIGLKYQTADEEGEDEGRKAEGGGRNSESHPDEVLTLKIRYKAPDGDVSTPLEFPLVASLDALRQETIDFRFATAVAEFGMLLRGSQHVGDGSYDQVLELAREALGDDPHGYRAEFLDVVRRARELKSR